MPDNCGLSMHGLAMRGQLGDVGTALKNLQNSMMGFIRSTDFEECYRCKELLLKVDKVDVCPQCGLEFGYEPVDSVWIPEGCLLVDDGELLERT